MKNQSIIISLTVLGCAALAVTANALPQQYPPLHSGANASASPAGKSSGGSSQSKLSSKDKSFMMAAAKGGMMEVEWGKVAGEHGQNADVKKFGNRMVTDHTKANNELMALAKADGVSLPGAKSAGKWKSDKDYMDMMVKDHEKDLSEFQAEAQNGTDADLKKFADKTSKVISKHLQMAKEIQGKLK